MVTKVWDMPEIWNIQVNLPQNPLRNLNAYVIHTSAGNLVVDTGFNRQECREALWSGLEELSIDMSHTSLFLTHLHSDHIGLVQDFVDQGCTVYMGSIDYAYFSRIKAGDIWPYMEDLFRREGFPAEELPRQETENQGRRYAPERIFPAVTVEDGTRLHLGDLELVCIHTPGHTPGHMVLYLPKEQILFSGDHILFDITPNISVWRGTPHSLMDYLKSLDKIERLPIRVTLPAHRGTHEDVKARIQEIKSHHASRLEEIQAAVSRLPGANAHQIASQIHWSARGKPWEEFPPHQKWFAVGETLAHLYALRDQGAVIRKEAAENITYWPAKDRV